MYAQQGVTDTNDIRRLIKTAADNIDTDPKLVYTNSEKALKASEKLGFDYGIAASNYYMGVSTMKMGGTAKAKEIFYNVLTHSKAKGYLELQGNVLNSLGAVFVNLGSYDSALQYFMRSLDIRKLANDTDGMAASYKNIGNSYSNSHNFTEAIENYAHAEEIFSSKGPSLKQADLYSNWAACYVIQSKFKEGISMLHKSINIFRLTKDSLKMTNVLTNMGICYSYLNEKDSALYFLNEAMRLCVKTSDVNGQEVVIYNIADVYEKNGEYRKAIKLYDSALKMATVVQNWLAIYDCNLSLGNNYELLKDYKKALYYKNIAFEAQDSLLTREKVNAIAMLTAKFANKEIEAENKTLQNENSIQKLKLQRKDIFLYGGGIGLLLILGFGILVIRNNKLHANQQLLRVEQKQLLAQMNPHFIFNCLNSIQQYIVQNDAANANRYLADFALLMRQTLDNSKDGTISLFREVEYLENYLSLESMRFDNKFSYEVKVGEGLNPNNVELPSMIIQPFVENAIHHGLRNLEEKPGALTVRFFKENGSLFCEVDDNGVGIEESQRLKEQQFLKYKSHGMELTRQRLALVSKMNSSDYQITVINKKAADNSSAGTRILIKFPFRS